MLNELFEVQIDLAGHIDLTFKRYLYSKINWDSRLIAILGARGVGKTTLLLQHYREKFTGPKECLYVSADNVKVSAVGLYEIAGEFYKKGGHYFIVDEVHKYPEWSGEIKNIYDSFPGLKVAISGSSTLDIMKGKHDLSRRLASYQLKGLSFREFLELETKSKFTGYTLKKILDDHIQISTDILKKIKPLKYFGDYLLYGCYPFYIEDRSLFLNKLNNTIEKVVSEDIPSVFNLKQSSIPILRKLIFLIASSQPFSPNIDKLSSQLSVSKEYIYHYIEYLERAGLFSFLRQPSKGFRAVRKPSKIYMDNPNLFYAVLGREYLRAEIGAVRESFFLNQLSGAGHSIYFERAGDFKIDDSHVFEVGGKNKGPKQIQGIKDSYLALDGIEVGDTNKIPLWLFGFLY